MKRQFLSFVLLMIVLNLSSQSYPFDSIPENLKRRADAVVRSEQCLFTIVDASHATEKIKIAITLLNERSYHYRYVKAYYDKTSRVNYLRGTIYDEKGNIIKVLGITDVYDMSAIPGGTFYSDDRMKFLYFPIYKFPYTIEYEYETEYSSLYSYTNWYFQNGPGLSVERSGIQFSVPKGADFRFYEEDIKNKIDSVITSDSRIYTWQEENIPAINQQAYAVKTHYPWPSIFTAPLDFEYGGYKGSLRSWKTYGEWMYNLIKGLDVLPPSEMTKISEITAKTDDVRERIKLIYEYMQSTTRYVSIQIGIGGLRPSEAAMVAKNGYGDCKALVNYTMALLKGAGITSYYTLIKSGPDGKVIKDFVNDQFDHIILCVPTQKDTVWLECTDQRSPFNFLGNFTDDRYALLITPDGGKLVKTPAFKKGENVIKRTGTISMNNFGKSTARLSYYYSGMNYDTASARLGQASREELTRYLNRTLRFSDIDLTEVNFSETKTEKPSAIFAYNAGINDYAVLTGKVISFNPSIDNAQYLRDIPMPMEVPEDNISYDSIAFNLPLGYKVEFKPDDVRLENEFGKYNYRVEAKNDKLIYKRYLEMNKGEIPLEKFQAFRSFINSVAKTDRGMIILKN